MPHDPNNFVGAWSLVDWRIEYSDGAITRPFGDGAHGYIIYEANGFMTASIAKAKRENFGIPNARNASPSQKSEAFDSYFHYAGPWNLEDEHVVHTVTMSLNPDMTGTEQRRFAVFDGRNGLTLSAREEMNDGSSRHHILQWQKID